MDDLELILNNSLSNYFKHIEKVGYMSDTNVYQLVLLDFLNTFVRDYSDYLWDEDYAQIKNVINCLYSNSCLINWDKCDFKLPKVED